MKSLKLGINDNLPLLSLSDIDNDDKKINSIAVEREKEEKAILSSLPIAVVNPLDGYEEQIGEAEPLPNSYVRFMERSGEELDGNLFPLSTKISTQIKQII